MKCPEATRTKVLSKLFCPVQFCFSLVDQLTRTEFGRLKAAFENDTNEITMSESYSLFTLDEPPRYSPMEEEPECYAEF